MISSLSHQIFAAPLHPQARIHDLLLAVQRRRRQPPFLLRGFTTGDKRRVHDALALTRLMGLPPPATLGAAAGAAPLAAVGAAQHQHTQTEQWDFSRADQAAAESAAAAAASDAAPLGRSTAIIHELHVCKCVALNIPVLHEMGVIGKGGRGLAQPYL